MLIGLYFIVCYFGVLMTMTFINSRLETRKARRRRRAMRRA